MRGRKVTKKRGGSKLRFKGKGGNFDGGEDVGGRVIYYRRN